MWWPLLTSGPCLTLGKHHPASQQSTRLGCLISGIGFPILNLLPANKASPKRNIPYLRIHATYGNYGQALPTNNISATQASYASNYSPNCKKWEKNPIRELFF